MGIKITDIAKSQLDRLAPVVRARVISRVRASLPGAAATDPAVRLDNVDGDVRVHSLGNGDPVILYRMDDIDEDGEAEPVILTVIDPAQVSALVAPTVKTVGRGAPGVNSVGLGDQLSAILNTQA